MTKILMNRAGAVLGLMIATGFAAPLARAHSHVVVGFGFGGPGYYAPYPPSPYYEVPDHALLDTDVEPEEASVYVDGERLGIADNFDGFPRYLAVSPGRHTVEFRASGFRTLRIRLYAQPGALYDIPRQLNPLGQGSDTNPQEMKLGEPEPPARPHVRPRSAPPPPEDPGKPSGSEPPDTAPGSNGTVDEAAPDRGSAEPAAREGTIVFKIRPDDAAVYLDGKFLGAGETLGGPDGVNVSAGSHRLQIVKPGYQPFRTTVDVHSGRSRTLTVELESAMGGEAGREPGEDGDQ